jgi:hypothetical protein
MTDERFKEVYQRYKNDPNFNDEVNRLLEVMEDYRFSSDPSGMWEQWWHEAILMAEAIYGANVSHTNLADILEFAEEVRQ